MPAPEFCGPLRRGRRCKLPGRAGRAARGEEMANPKVGNTVQAGNVEVVVTHGDPVACTNCNRALAEVIAVEKLGLTVHCPYCGADFGVTVFPSGVERET